MAFITAQDAMQKYGFKEAQLLHLINENAITLYGEYKEKKGSAEYFYAAIHENFRKGVYEWLHSHGEWIIKPQNEINLEKLLCNNDLHSISAMEMNYIFYIENMYEIKNSEGRKRFFRDICAQSLKGYYYSTGELESTFHMYFPDMFIDYQAYGPGTSYFIFSGEITSKYSDIGESHLYEAIEQDRVRIYDYQGYDLGGFAGFSKTISPTHYKNKPLQAICDCVFFVRSEIVSIFGKTISESEISDFTNEEKTSCLTKQKPEKNRSTISKAACYAAYEEAVGKYESEHLRRANDALPKRVRLLLRYLQGEPAVKIEESQRSRNGEPYVNLHRDMQLARKKDIPKLHELYSELPPLE